MQVLHEFIQWKGDYYHQACSVAKTLLPENYTSSKVLVLLYVIREGWQYNFRNCWKVILDDKYILYVPLLGWCITWGDVLDVIRFWYSVVDTLIRMLVANIPSRRLFLSELELFLNAEIMTFYCISILCFCFIWNYNSSSHNIHPNHVPTCKSV